MNQKFEQHLRRIYFNNDLAFKIKTGTVTPVFMYIACITVYTPMLATGIRIHTVHHAEVGAFYFVYDTFYFLLHVLSGYIRFFPIINGFNMFFCSFIFQKTVFCIELGTSALQVLRRVLLVSFFGRAGSFILPGS